MEEYRRMISSRVLGNVDRMIDNLPQATMFGGKRQRDFVLPASTEYDYPASLSVGHLRDSSRVPQTLGGSFFSDFGETEFLDEDTDEYHLEGGRKFNLGKALKPLAPVAKELLKEGVKEGVKSYAKGGKRGSFGKAMKQVGKALKPVGKAVAPVAKEIFEDVILPEGKKALREYIRNMGSGGEEEVSGAGYNNRRPPPFSKRKQAKPQRPSDVVASMIGREYSDFKSTKMKNPSNWIKAHYPAKKKMGKKAKKPELVIKEDEEESIPASAPKPRGRPKKQQVPKVKGQKKEKSLKAVSDMFGSGYDGGVLIRDVPSQFHSSVYPPALRSYSAGDAYGSGYSGGAKSGGKRGGARGAIVKEVMRKYGLSLPEASKFVKEQGLY